MNKQDRTESSVFSDVGEFLHDLSGQGIEESLDLLALPSLQAIDNHTILSNHITSNHINNKKQKLTILNLFTSNSWMIDFMRTLRVEGLSMYN